MNNFTFNIPTVSGSNFAVSTSQNSSTIDYHLAATVLTRTVTADIYFTQKGYNYKIAIIGTISGTAITFPLVIPFGNTNSVCDTGSSSTTSCFSVMQGHLGLDWSDSKGFSPSYVNTTKTLTFTIGNSFSIDPIAIDTSGSCSHAGTTNTCTTASFTTTARNDLLLMFIWTSNAVPDCEAQTETSSPGLTWRERNNIGSPTGGFNSEFCEYYAQWDSAGAITVTCLQATNGKGGCFIIAISDAMIKPPSFDTGLCVNQRTLVTTTTTTITACPVTSYNQRDLLIGAIAVNQGNPTITAGSGFTLVGCRQGNLVSVCVEDQFVSSTQTNTKATWVDVTNSGSTAWFLSDTVEEFRPDIVQTTSCTFTSVASPTCAFANNLVAGDTALVIPLAAGNGAVSVSTVTDTQSLTYSKIVSESVSVGGDAEGWWACNAATAAADTVTVNWGSAQTGRIVIYELTPSDTSCTVRSSVGTSGSANSASVTAYTPLNASLVIGGIAANGLTGAGTGYLGDTPASQQRMTEHATNNGTSETTPFTLPQGAEAYNEISMSFVRPTPNALITTSTTTTTPTTTTTSTTTTTTSTKNIADPANFSWLLLLPFVLIGIVLVFRRR